MTKFLYTVQVDTVNQAYADKVMDERIECDEDYGFDYEISLAGYAPSAHLLAGAAIKAMCLTGSAAHTAETYREKVGQAIIKAWMGKIAGIDEEGDETVAIVNGEITVVPRNSRETVQDHSTLESKVESARRTDETTALTEALDEALRLLSREDLR